jgi:hypothetical protein
VETPQSMKSRWLINLLLLSGAVLLTLVVWLEPGVEKETPKVKVTALEREQVNRIHLQRQRHPDLALEKNAAGHWQIRHDPLLPADSFHVNALIKLADQEAVRSYPVSALDLTRLELDPPASSITLNQTRIDFGRQEALESLRYVRRGDRVLLIPDLYQYLVDADYSQFVRRRLFAEDRHITAIHLPDFSLRKDDGQWHVSINTEVSADDIQRFIHQWETVSALLVKKAGEPGDRTIRVELDSPVETLSFKATANDKELILIRDGYSIQYHLGNENDRLLQLPSATVGSDNSQ